MDNTQKKIGNLRKFYNKLYSLLQSINKTIDEKNSPLNYFAIFFVVALAIIFPIVIGANYFSSNALAYVLEIIFAVVLIIYIALTILFHRKDIWHWITVVVLLFHYISLLGIFMHWDEQAGILYLGIATVFFLSYASWSSAKKINKSGGIIDTTILAIGMVLVCVGLITQESSIPYSKWLIVIGLALIYLYAIARALLWVFFPPKEQEHNIIKTMILVVVYIALIVAVPFILQYANVDNELIRQIIVPIYAAVIGGVLTLVGVAWTIRHSTKERELAEEKRETERKEEEKKKYKPLAIYFKGGKRINYTITLNEYDENRFVSLQKSDKNRCARIIKDFMLRNLDLNDFFVEGLIFNESSKLLRYANLYVEKNKIILFSFQDTMLYFAQPIEKIGVLVKDLLNNEYILELGFENEIQAPEKICIHITGSKGIIEYKENEGQQNG